MRRQISAAVFLVLLGLMTLSSPAIAQQKTAKACADEWRANKAANQANGITKKAYVATCRGGTALSQPTARPTAAPSPAPTVAAPQVSTGQRTAKACAEEWRANEAANQANGITEKAYVSNCRSGTAPAQSGPASTVPVSSAPAPAPASTQSDTGQKTVKACRAEWGANKATNQANGVTESAYVEQCRGGATPSQTSATPASPAPAPTTAATTPAPTSAPANSSPASNARPVPTNSGTPAGPNEFSTEAQAKTRCPTDTVVWVNLNSKIYHFIGTRNYGTTEHGAYMCEADAKPAGMRAAKNEKHP